MGSGSLTSFVAPSPLRGSFVPIGPVNSFLHLYSAKPTNGCSTHLSQRASIQPQRTRVRFCPSVAREPRKMLQSRKEFCESSCPRLAVLQGNGNGTYSTKRWPSASHILFLRLLLFCLLPVLGAIPQLTISAYRILWFWPVTSNHCHPTILILVSA